MAERDRNARGELFGGAGLGLLIGTLLGISISNVVAGVVGAIAAGLAAYLGLRSDSATKGDATSGYPLRTGAFGVACVLGVLLGVAIRANQLLTPSPQKMTQRWIQAGYDPDTARQLVAYEELGIAPKAWQITSGERVVARTSSVLFATSAEHCSDLTRDRYKTDEEWINALSLVGGPWEQLTKATTTLSAADREAALNAALRLACESPVK